MAGETARIGIVAGEFVSGWQHDALAALRAEGVAIAARFAPCGAGPLPLPAPAAWLAGDAAARFGPRPWEAPPLAPPERAAELDAVLAFADPADAAALARARWGLWEVVLPGVPPAFDLVERAQPAAEVRVERRAPDPAVLARGAVAVDRASYAVTLGRIAALAGALPSDALRRCAAASTQGGPIPLRPSPQRIGPARAARLGVRCALRRAAGALTRRIVHARWRIGLLRTAPETLTSGETAADVAWLDLPRGRFWADPFPYVAQGRAELLCEGYDYARERGYLARFALDGGRVAGPPRPLSTLEHHLSYPYVVADGERRYVVPEQSQARRVALYELHEDGLREAAVLLEGVAAVDPTLLGHGGRWWLFCTDAERDDNGALLLFHAPELHGPWRPHPLNPVVRDARGARPAGTPFVAGGALYRPAQDCSTGYGARIALARIDRLDPAGYRETVVAHLAPPRTGPGRHGLHTLALGDGIRLVDGKDLVLDAAATWAMLRADLRRLRGRATPAAPSPSFGTEVPLRS